MYSVVYTKQARKALKAMPRNTAALILEKIERLAADPHRPNPNVKALVGAPGFRLRIGDWRVVYEIEEQVVTILVLRVSPRGGSYP